VHSNSQDSRSLISYSGLAKPLRINNQAHPVFLTIKNLIEKKKMSANFIPVIIKKVRKFPTENLKVSAKCNKEQVNFPVQM
jgi:hypothetical protein